MPPPTALSSPLMARTSLLNALFSALSIPEKSISLISINRAVSLAATSDSGGTVDSTGTGLFDVTALNWVGETANMNRAINAQKLSLFIFLSFVVDVVFVVTNIHNNSQISTHPLSPSNPTPSRPHISLISNNFISFLPLKSHSLKTPHFDNLPKPRVSQSPQFPNPNRLHIAMLPHSPESYSPPLLNKNPRGCNMGT